MVKGDPRAHAQMRYLRGWAAGGGGRLTIIGFAGKEHNPMDPYNETGQHSSPAAARAGRPTSDLS